MPRGTKHLCPRAWTALVGALLLGTGPVVAQTDNVCNAGEAPDLIVGEILPGLYTGTVGGISAYAFGTDSCNVGTCQAEWFGLSAAHPVIGQNLFRLKEGRFQQIGQSWVKHGFAAIDETTCSPDCLEAPDDEHLGINCSDVYQAELNGYQRALGPKSEVQARTGIFLWPPTGIGLFGDVIYKRLQVHVTDLDPALNPGAEYFVEAQYVSRDDALGGNQNNNASHIAANVAVAGDGSFRIILSGGSYREMPAIYAWQAADPAVLISPLDMLGRYYVGARVTDLGNGTWHYQYAVQNLNADGAAKFTVPVNGGASVANVSFSDVDYHSGEPYDGTDWPAVFDPSRGTLTWATVTLDELSNALRWGTLYSFGFDSNLPPELGSITLGPYFIEQSLESVDKADVQTWVPRACDSDGACEPAENCNNCPSDCPGIGTSGFCGDGICDPTSGEDCLGCAQDCSGQQSGNPGARYCCGDGDGQGPVDCTDPRCSAAGFVCASPCCGDGFCDFGEGSCNCAPDCGAPAPVETACVDGADDDCDERVDCADLDCCVHPACVDGIDGDGDSVADCDCDDANGTVWTRPGEVQGVLLVHDAASATSTITWSPPLVPGGTAVTYAVLRSVDPTSFVVAASCLVLADPHAAVASEIASPSPGTAFHYLVRAENACPGDEGRGTLGISAGTEREGRTCP